MTRKTMPPGVRSVAEIDAPSITGLVDLAVMPGLQETERETTGYSLGDVMLPGSALLTARNLGVRLVYRLKDTRPLLHGEIAFWGRLLASLAPDGVDLVSHAPSSGKVPANEHLATLLAQACALELNKSFASVFRNDHPRQRRGSRVTKLQEEQTNQYHYSGPSSGALVLVVDDVVFTRSTAHRCASAVLQNGDRVSFAVLYRA